MSKLMVVGSDHLLARVLAAALAADFEEVVLTGHEEALDKFLVEEPTHVLVLDYDEKGNGLEVWCCGRVTWQDIKNSADPGVVMVRFGFSHYDYPDYIQLPFKPDELKKILQI